MALIPVLSSLLDMTLTPSRDVEGLQCWMGLDVGSEPGNKMFKGGDGSQ